MLANDPDYSDYFKSNILGFAGDWHGDTFWALKTLDRADSNSAPIVYQLGDFGLWGGVDGNKYLRKIQKKLEEKNMLLVVTPGNHENYDILEKMPQNSYGFHTRNDINRIFFAPRGHTWLQADKIFASIGGAGSIDKQDRTVGQSWWFQEEITEYDIEAYIANARKMEKIDVLLTHECPAGVAMGEKNTYLSPEIVHYCYKQRILLRDAIDQYPPKILLHGHWHRFHETFIDGVTYDNKDYRTKIVGLNMNNSYRNLLIAKTDDYYTLETIHTQ